MIARWNFRLAAALALALAAAPLAAARDDGRHEVWRGVPLIELDAAWPGARLAAGETVALDWNATAALDREIWIEEWEAFLSVDGGESYPIRLTPHLDIRKRRFAVRLPELPTEAARLLVRMGDERRELELEMPWTFAIADASRPVSPSRTLAGGPGEPARGGEQGVFSWMEGARDGTGAREVQAPSSSLELHSVSGGFGVALAALAPASRAPSIPLCALFSHPEIGVASATATTATVEVSFPSVDPRQSTCRQNE